MQSLLKKYVKMISLYSTYNLIFIHLISNVHSQSSPGDILGPSACDTSGVQQDFCGFPDAPIESFPDGCSSYLYYGVDIINNTITDQRENAYSVKGYLDKLIETNKSVLIYYAHRDIMDWCAVIQCNNTAGQTTEINNLKMYLDQHKGIKGIVFWSLLLPADDSTSVCSDYNQNLKSYIDLMKKTFTDLSFGIYIPALEEMIAYQNPDFTWLDFKVLDPVVDFYVLSLTYVNECSEEFLKSGQYPLTGGSNYTVDQVRTLVERAGANSSKIHYRFSVNAETFIEKDPSADKCTTYVSSYCKCPRHAKTTMCADTIQSLFDKGAYAKQYGAGFVLNNIDTDDFDCTCQCGQSYPGFHAVLSGYNGEPPPPPCALFDRTLT